MIVVERCVQKKFTVNITMESSLILTAEMFPKDDV